MLSIITFPIKELFRIEKMNSPPGGPGAILEECGPLSIQEKDNTECLQHPGL